MNVSPRLVTYAAKVLDRGCPELIAAVESGGLKVSIAARFAGVPRERQIEELARGPQRAAPKPRARRKRKNEPNSPPPCPGSFGVFPNQAPQGEQGPREHGIVLLWVGVGGLAEASQALQVRGVRFAG